MTPFRPNDRTDVKPWEWPARMSTYYTDREYGARAPAIDTIDERLWAGLFSLIQTRIGNGSFGFRFPEQ
ncbi:hypothetical protein ACVWYH_005502 [Bradyrhizobium sp. GM24.11]